MLRMAPSAIHGTNHVCHIFVMVFPLLFIFRYFTTVRQLCRVVASSRDDGRKCLTAHLKQKLLVCFLSLVKVGCAAHRARIIGIFKFCFVSEVGEVNIYHSFFYFRCSKQNEQCLKAVKYSAMRSICAIERK